MLATDARFVSSMVTRLAGRYSKPGIIEAIISSGKKILSPKLQQSALACPSLSNTKLTRNTRPSNPQQPLISLDLLSKF